MRSKVTRWLRRHGVRGLDGREGEPGSVSVIQRFGSTLSVNAHVHMLVLDGLFVEDERGSPVWRRARRWRQADVDGLVVWVAAEVERLLARRGHGPTEPLEVDPDDALADLQAAAAALVPPPAANQVVNGVVLAPRHRWHRLVRPPVGRPAVPAAARVRLTRRARGTSRHVGWAELLWRTFGVFGAACATFGAVMRLRAVLCPPATLDVLASLRRSARGAARGNAGYEA